MVEAAGGPGPFDVVLLMARMPADLDLIGHFRDRLREDGAIWVLRTKGQQRTVSEHDVIGAGRRFRLVDNKIASFSERLAAMRLVVPLALRRDQSSSIR